MNQPSAQAGPMPPGWSVALARIGVLAILAAYFFVIYAIARGLIPTFGYSTPTILKASLMTAAMGSLVIWLVIGIEFPEMICSHVIPMRRHRQNRCHACGHPCAGEASTRCTECGTDLTKVPGSYAPSWQTARRFLVVLFLGLIVGICAGEWAMSSDEARMQQMVQSLTTPNFNQPPAAAPLGNTPPNMQFRRRWPANFSEVEWSPSTGFTPVPIFHQERILP